MAPGRVVERLSVWDVMGLVGADGRGLGVTIPVVELPLTDRHPWWACQCGDCTEIRDGLNVAARVEGFDEKKSFAQAALASKRENLLDDSDCLKLAAWMAGRA